MKLDRAKIGLAVLLALIVFSVLTLLYWNFIRDTIVVPIYYLIWVGDHFLRSIPQATFLTILVLICAVIGLNTLGRLRGRQIFRNPTQNKPQPNSRYRFWRSVCRNMYASHFSREQFHSDARRLALSVIAYEQGISTFEAESLVRSGALTVPQALRDLIEQKEIYAQKPQSSFIQRLLVWLHLLNAKAPSDPQLDYVVAEFINFIEPYGETTYDRNQPES